MGARSRGRAATPRRRHGAASGGGQGLGGREPDVLDRDDALAHLVHLAELACCCAPALDAALLAAGAHEPHGGAGEAAARQLRPGAGGGGGGALCHCPSVT